MATRVEIDKGTWQYLSPGNTKTGDAASFDLPAKTTCPGMTDACGSKCYAFNVETAYPNVGKKYLRNYAFAETPEFVSRMCRDLPYRGVVRIHVSGDFYSVAYVRKWIKIAQTRRDCHFYFYTRSWRKRAIWTEIRKLAQLDNVTCNVSCDIDTGKPVKTADPYKWCYLTHDDKVPGWLRATDLVFRSAHNGQKRRRKNAAKKDLDPNNVAPLIHNLGRNNTAVCPKERGKDIPLKCSRCRICI